MSLDPAGNGDLLALDAHVLLHHASIRSLWQSGARENARRLSALETALDLLACRDPHRHLEPRIACSERGVRERIAVDRRIGKARHIARRGHIFCENSPSGMFERNGFHARHGSDPLHDQADRLVMGEPLAVVQEAIVHKHPRPHRRPSPSRSMMKSAIPGVSSRSNTGTGGWSMAALLAIAMTVLSLPAISG